MALLLSSSQTLVSHLYIGVLLRLLGSHNRIKKMSKTNEIIRLNTINDKTRTKTVAVRILRLWVQKDLCGKEGLEMIIIDEWGDKIQASISVGLKRKFLPLLKEGHIILIKNFQVWHLVYDNGHICIKSCRVFCSCFSGSTDQNSWDQYASFVWQEKPQIRRGKESYLKGEKKKPQIRRGKESYLKGEKKKPQIRREKESYLKGEKNHTCSNLR